MGNEELAFVWQQRIIDQEESGLNIAAWCREQSISRHKFFYWRKRLGVNKARGTDVAINLPVKWVPLDNGSRNQAYHQANSISVHVGPARIELTNGFDPETFRQTVLVLKNL